ncbi:MAG: undecaprenyl-diphosphate phosphatase, partial [Saprospiraceae bacterium]|nr:undecaprenyl-diphosphate phosphatase [Saprospiraceae bacterium]
MNDFLEAILLGIVQGITEFLPVSSSGHLELAKFLTGNEVAGERSLLFTVLLHFATALATLWVFRKEVAEILQACLQKPINESQRFILMIVISMLPAVAVGLYFDDLIASLFSQRLVLVGIALLVTALLLFFADLPKLTDQKVTYGKALLLGMAQAVAIIPGISRSGATISTAILLKIDRDRAARFSFLMVVPLILGKMTKDVLDGAFLQSDGGVVLIIGFLAAFISGALACQWMIRL